MGTTTIIAALNLQRKTGTVAPVVIKVLLNRFVVFQQSTGIKIPETCWDSDERKVLKPAPNYQIINQKITRQISEWQALLLKKELLGVTLTKSFIKSVLSGNDPGQDFYAFCEGWIKKKYTQPETIRTYNSELSKLKAFKETLHFGDLNFQFFSAYKTYMLTVLGNSGNTVWKTFKFLNTMLNDAVKIGGLIAENPMRGFNRGKYENPVRLGLAFEDCDRIERLCLAENQPVILRVIAARFLLMCYSGLRFNDAMGFNCAAHITQDQRLQLKTEKQGVTVVMKLHDRLQRAVDYCTALPQKELSNQKYNVYLKAVGGAAAVKRSLTAHLGRHTFGTLLAESGIPIEEAQKLLGHKDIDSTKIYYHVTVPQLDRAVEKLNGRE